MKIFKCIAAVATAAALALTVTGCHKAGEVVATYDDIKVTSGVYLYMLLDADSAARDEVDSQTGDAANTSTNRDYSKTTVTTPDGKKVKFYDYVKAEAKDGIYQYIATEVLAKKYKVTLTDEDKASLASIDSYWDAYYAPTLEKNGIGINSYKDYVRNAQLLRPALFTAIYGKDGDKAVSADEIQKYIDANFCIANVITSEFSTTDADGVTSTLTEDQKKEALELLNKYADRLNKGEDFETIYHEWEETQKAEEESNSSNTSSTVSSTATSSTTTSSTAASSTATSSETATSSDATSSGEEKEEEKKPLDEHATLLYSAEFADEAGYVASENFDDILAMKTSEVKVIENDGNYKLVVKGDINADPYYADTLDEAIRSTLKSDEFLDLLESEAKKLGIKFDEGELRYLNPKKIKY